MMLITYDFNKDYSKLKNKGYVFSTLNTPQEYNLYGYS